ncbi:MAG: hemolysin III family protein [Paludibacteraceae bacterium]|nr:hemolysin III family protein [Paludibacteraceae bacterium]
MFDKEKAEFANTWTHAVALLLFCLMAIPLLMRAFSHGSAALDLGMILFVVGEVMMFGSSTLYHWFRDPEKKRMMRYFDHSAIYVSIAGSYSPILLHAIGGTLGNVCFFVIWSLTLLGIVYKIFFLGKYPKFSLGLYLVMGWLIIILIKPVFETFPASSLWMLLGEGIAFTLGTYFFWKDDTRTYYHSIWHVFVFVGCLFHCLLLWFLL